MPHKQFRQTCHVFSHASGVIDAEIAEKGHLWTETSYHHRVHSTWLDRCRAGRLRTGFFSPYSLYFRAVSLQAGAF